MGKFTWIIVLVVIVWQVVAAIAQNAAKKQQREKLSDLARTRRGQTPTAGPRSTGATLQAPTSTSASPLGGTAGARASDLAARRRAQLEELRRRRGAATRSGKTTLATQARVGRAPGPPPGQPSPQQRKSKTIQSVKADFKSVREAEDRSRQERVTEKQQGRDIQDAQRRREDIEAKDRVKSRQDAQRAQAKQEPHDEKDAYAERRRSTKSRRARFARALGNIDTVRDLYVLKEILEPPISLRPTRV